DLEDAVAPEAKVSAREQVVATLDEGGFGRREVAVRVNGLSTPWGQADVMAVARASLDAVVFPKVESAADVEAAIYALESAGAPHDLPIWLMAETPQGVLNIEEIAGSHPRIKLIVMGTSDLAKELRVKHTLARTGLITSLGLCVLAARCHGLDILDGVTLDLEDSAGFQALCQQGRDLGFDGKTLIHPKQIA
ncbi:MAG: CoA ester lyase, partial [Planctomycetes bacterium]|nr:CoA ester lyase [Planctomycetota bacterium]